MTQRDSRTGADRQLVFDVGMYDGSDTQYYLESGYRVVAIEANPTLAESARRRFADEIKGGSLTVVNAAIADGDADVELTVCGEDLGSSSIVNQWVANRSPMGTYKVPATSIGKLIGQFGV